MAIMKTFCLLYMGYLANNYLRSSVSYVSPAIIESEKISKSDIGLILSSQMTGYMLIKFLGGTLVDKIDPTIIINGSLIFAGLLGAAFTVCTSIPQFAFLWFLCGMAQGPAWSACAILLKRTVPPEQFGSWWSLLSTSLNVAGTLGPFLSAAIVINSGWKTSVLVASTASLGLGFISFAFLKCEAESCGDNSATGAETPGRVKDLFKPSLILVYMIYTTASFVRGATNDWGQLYLIQNKGHSLTTGSVFTSSQEVGGIIGSLLTGCISDYMVSKSKNPGKTTSRLSFIMCISLMQSVAFYLFIFYVGTDSSQMWISFTSFSIGFCMYSIINLVGITSMEIAPKKLGGTAHSFAALGGNIGRIISGYPLSLVATQWSWQESFYVALGVSVSVAVISTICRKLLSNEIKAEKKDS